MPTDAERFQEALDAYPDLHGCKRMPEGRFDGSPLGVVLRSIRRNATTRGFGPSDHESPPSEVTPRIYFDFVDDESVNAFAITHNNNGFIAMNWGAPARVYGHFMATLARPDVLEFIGNPAAEDCGRKLTTLDTRLESPDPSVLHRMWDILSSKCFTLARLVPEDYAPRDLVREQAAWWLSNLALDFILTHEIAHILGGHCDFWADKFGLAAIQEAVSSSADTPKTMLRQALETDADASGIGNPLTRTLECAARYLGESGPMRGVLQDEKTAVTLCFLACDTVFKIFERESEGAEDLPWRERTHPPLPLRRIQLVAYFQAVLKTLGRSDLDYSLDGAIDLALATNEAASDRLFGRPRDDAGMSRALGDEGTEHAKEIGLAMSSIQSEIRNFVWAHLGSTRDPETPIS